MVAAAGAGTVAAADAAKPAATGFTLTKLATMPAGVTNCNDLTSLGTADYTQTEVPLGNVFVGCSNGVSSSGGGSGTSTVVEYTTAGTYVAQWSVANQIAGMAAEPLHRRILMPLNSSSNSELVFLDPNIPGSFAEVQYAYSPDPQSTGAASSLQTGGGTQSVVVDSNDDIFVTASHPTTLTATASFKVTLTPPAGAPPAKGTATLTPTFSDDATATNGNTGKGKVKLALREIDANAIVPQSSPRYGGDYVVDDKATHQLVFSSTATSGKLTVLKTALGLRDIRWATSSGGTFYLVGRDNKKPLATSSLYKVTGPFVTGDAYATTTNGELVRVNLTTGKLTPIVSGIGKGVGLLYVNADQTVTQLPVNGD